MYWVLKYVFEPINNKITRTIVVNFSRSLSVHSTHGHIESVDHVYVIKLATVEATTELNKSSIAIQCAPEFLQSIAVNWSCGLREVCWCVNSSQTMRAA